MSLKGDKMRFILATCIWEDLVQRKKPVTDRLKARKEDTGETVGNAF